MENTGLSDRVLPQLCRWVPRGASGPITEQMEAWRVGWEGYDGIVPPPSTSRKQTTSKKLCNSINTSDIITEVLHLNYARSRRQPASQILSFLPDSCTSAVVENFYSKRWRRGCAFFLSFHSFSLSLSFTERHWEVCSVALFGEWVEKYTLVSDTVWECLTKQGSK